MKIYVKSSLYENSRNTTTDPKTGKPVVYLAYFSSKAASDIADKLKASGYKFKRDKLFKHGYYSIYENDEEIAVIMYDDGEANYNRPYSK